MAQIDRNALERYAVSTLQAQNITGFISRCDIERQTVEDCPDSPDLLGIRLCQFADRSSRLSSSPTRTLPPRIAAMVTIGIWWRPAASTENDSPRRTACRRSASCAVRFSGSAPMPPSTPKTNWTNRVRLQSARVAEMGQRVEMADIVALELEAGAAAFARVRTRMFSISLKVFLEDRVARRLKQLRLPLVLPVAIALVERGKEPEIHRAHIERAHFRPRPRGRRQPLIQRSSASCRRSRC